VRQATALGGRLANARFDAVYCSDLKRCRDTLAAVLPAHQGAQFDPRLREKSSGIFEGGPIDAVDKEAIRQGISPENFCPEGGESWADVRRRCQSFLFDITSEHLVAGRPAKVLVVSHCGLLMELVDVVWEWAGEVRGRRPVCKNASLGVLRLEKTERGGKVTELVWNDTSHLD
jgi:broad specificity phosphatase PhoE